MPAAAWRRYSARPVSTPAPWPVLIRLPRPKSHVRRSPPRTVAAVTAAYTQLGTDTAVAVRSSGTTEDAGDASFAGMNASFTNVVGAEQVLAAIKRCWASLYGERVLAYRAEQGLHEEPAIAVVVQQMVPSEVSGVMFTADPASGARDRLVIEAVLGQGEAIVSGRVEPDTYVVSKAGFDIISARLGRQRFKIVRGEDGGDREVPLETGPDGERVLTGDQIKALAATGVAVEQHYGRPQDVEWACAAGKTFLVQSRPITTLAVATEDETTAAPLLSGLAASTGSATGRVRILTSPQQQAEMRDGEVLVAEMTSPDWVPAMRRAAALVTDEGGMTCHAAIVSRELRLPCVVGTREATGTLVNGQLVTVDGRAGKVYPGRLTQGAQVTTGVAVAPTRRRRSPHSVLGSMSTWPLRKRPSGWLPCRSTGWGCCALSSWWPTPSAACIHGC